MMSETRPYAEQSDIFLRQAQEELANNLRQASEKGWGAASQMIKAVAQHRHWRHDEHRYLTAVVVELAAEDKDEELITCYDHAQELHRTFYEGSTNSFAVTLRLRQVETLINKLRRYLG